MAVLQLLEEKITSLVALAEALKQENEQLKKDLSEHQQENKKFKKQIEMLEGSMLNENSRIQELHKEKELTKTVVDDLIKNIDAIIKSENQQS